MAKTQEGKKLTSAKRTKEVSLKTKTAGQEKSNLYEKIRKAVDEASRFYINTREVVKAGDASLDLKDVLILGAITGTDCLLTGKTGSGKTRLANMVMSGLFGKNEYTNKTITPAMLPDDFLDIDFSVMKDGGMLQGAIKPLSIITKAGVVLNEANRAPAIVQNYLIPFLDKEMDIQGKGFYAGKELNKSGERYQYRVITINEGEEYSVEKMDKALRDRTVIEIPMDMFYQTTKDCLNMLDVQKEIEEAVSTETGKGVSDDIFGLFSHINKLEAEEKVLFFLVYLSGMGYCVKVNSSSKMKESINFSPRICESECHFSAQTDTNRHNICGHVYAPSQRALINLLKVSKGIAYMRAAKTGANDCKVTIDDVVSAAPFVLYFKIAMFPDWIKKHYQGNQWEAIKDVIEQAKGRCETITQKLAIDPSSPLKTFKPELLSDYVEKNNDVWALRLEELFCPDVS